MSIIYAVARDNLLDDIPVIQLTTQQQQQQEGGGEAAGGGADIVDKNTTISLSDNLEGDRCHTTHNNTHTCCNTNPPCTKRNV